MNDILYIFESTVDFSVIDPKSTLLTAQSDLTDLAPICHTSVGDLDPFILIDIAKKFKVIKFVDKNFDVRSNSYFETKCLLNYLSHHVTVENFVVEPLQNFCEFSDLVVSNANPSLWVFGCSHSAGTGLDSQNQAYPAILSEYLKLPLNLIAKPGTGVNWSFRHIVESNIMPNDIVIWQLTSMPRLSRFDGKKVHNIMLTDVKDRCLVDVNNNHQLFFEYFSLVSAGVKYLRAVGVKFLMIGVIPSDEEFYQCINEYTKYPEFLYLPKMYYDFGDDQLHMGPLSHKALANQLYNHLK